MLWYIVGMLARLTYSIDIDKIALTRKLLNLKMHIKQTSVQ